MKLALSEAASPSQLLITIPYLPGFSAGVMIFSVFISTSVTAADLPPMVAVTPALKPLPRMVKVARLDEEPLTGAIVPIPSGTRASWTIVKPDAVSENSPAIFVDSKKSSVQAVHIGAQHRERLRQDYAQ